MGWVFLAMGGMSFSGPLIKWALSAGANPATIAFLRMALSFLLLLPFSLRDGSLVRVLRAPRRQVGLGALSALFLALHYLCWMTSLRYTGTFTAMALVSTQPLFVALLSGLVLGEPVSRKSLPGALVAVLGAACIGVFSVESGGQGWLGDVLALSGAALMAGHWLLGRLARRTAPALGYTVFLYGACALCLLCALPLLGGFSAPAGAWPPVLLLVLLCTLGGHALVTRALGTVSADAVSLILLGEPIGAALWAYLFFGEALSWPVLLGGGLVMAGLFLYVWAGRSRPARS